VAVLFIVRNFGIAVLTLFMLCIGFNVHAQSVPPLSDSIVPPLNADSTPFERKTKGFVFDSTSRDSTLVKLDSIFPAPDTLRAKKIEKEKKHSPLKAALFSAVLPGLGQGYNKRYWKIPIVYAGLGGLGYALYYTAVNFRDSRQAYRLQVDYDSLTVGSYNGTSRVDELKYYRDYYKRFLDISILCTSIWYALNIIDAAVDAHLFYWNVNDDLTINWEPLIRPSNNYGFAQTSVGVKLRLGF
jgi:hypothetical protein